MFRGNPSCDARVTWWLLHNSRRDSGGGSSWDSDDEAAVAATILIHADLHFDHSHPLSEAARKSSRQLSASTECVLIWKNAEKKAVEVALNKASWAGSIPHFPIGGSIKYAFSPFVFSNPQTQIQEEKKKHKKIKKKNCVSRAELRYCIQAERCIHDHGSKRGYPV